MPEYFIPVQVYIGKWWQGLHTKKHKENLKEKKFRLKISSLIEDFDQFLKEGSDICIWIPLSFKIQSRAGMCTVLETSIHLRTSADTGNQESCSFMLNPIFTSAFFSPQCFRQPLPIDWWWGGWNSFSILC